MNKVLQAGLAAALLATAALAQGPPGPGSGGLHRRGEFRGGGFGPGMHPGKVVTGAPYQATATSTFTQVLANGNTIQRTMTATVARDDSGRTYEQETITGGPLASAGSAKVITFLSDPVAGYSYVIDASSKTARRRALHTPPANGGPATNLTPPQRPPNPNVVVNDIAQTTMNGVTVTGKSMTHTIPAGQIGNAKDIVWTDTVYTSPDLQVVVSATRNDPRFGSSMYALTNITKGEPTVSFAIPSDYTVEDVKGPGPRGPRSPE